MIPQTIFNELLKRIHEKRRFVQVLAGPRQVGKTTVVRQVMEASKIPAHYASADEPTLRDRTWLEQQWDIARLKTKEGKTGEGELLVIDEIQKIANWSSVVKLLWDEDTRSGIPLKVVLLGSAPLLIQSGLTESLAGRFEVIAVPHWSFTEMREAFGWNLEQYIFYGAYPGAAELVSDPERWRRYILDFLIETTISRDILLQTRIDKPALLRRLFQLGCAYSGQILSYQKMIGQLTDAGNTTTLAHYLELLQGAGMLAGLSKYTYGHARQRASSPKLQVLNTALMSAQDQHSIVQARQDPDYWGRLVESCIGAHLLNSSLGTSINVTYWRERNHEVDFVLQQGKITVAIEAKSSARRESLPGMDAFVRQFKPKRHLLVGGQGIELETFLSKPAAHWLQ
jgi:predicted AAA+ superfamily ATPase